MILVAWNLMEWPYENTWWRKRSYDLVWWAWSNWSLKMWSSKFKEAKKKFPMKLGCGGGQRENNPTKTHWPNLQNVWGKTWSAHKWCKPKKCKLQYSIVYNSRIKLGAIVNRFLLEKNQIPFALNGAQASHTKISRALEEWWP
jgi:hypothetical protein